MPDGESTTTIAQPARIEFTDKGLIVFGLYWWAFKFRVNGGAEQRMMATFGLSKSFTVILKANPLTAPLVRQFNRIRNIMYIVLIVGFIGLVATAPFFATGLRGDGADSSMVHAFYTVGFLGWSAFYFLLSFDLYRCLRHILHVYNESPAA